MESTNAAAVDPRSGYCAQTRTFHSFRPKVELPPTSQPLSVVSFTFSLLSSPLPTHNAFIDASNDASVSFEEFHSRVLSLSSSLLHTFPRLLSKGQVAFILAPNSLEAVVLYFSLLSIGVVVSPSNPTFTPREISHQITLSKPSLAFATSSTAHLLPPEIPTLLLDSPRYRSLLQHQHLTTTTISVEQTDTAAVFYSSGTTGPTKAVALSHRNLIAMVAGVDTNNTMVVLLSRPMCHIYGFGIVICMVASGCTTVVMGGDRSLETEEMLRAVERRRVAFIPLAPTLLEDMVRLPEAAVRRFDLSSLRLVATGGSSLRTELTQAFLRRFPNVLLLQGYGMTETTGAVATGMKEPQSQENNDLYESVGRLSANIDAKIVDPINGEAQPPGKQGELWLRGPSIMQGYLDDEVATANALHPEGWLKTGDLCYFDDDGYLFVLERLNQIIKYKTHQVFPTELEHVLHSHPKIADAAVVPYPDEEGGDIPMAYVVREAGSELDQDQIIEFVAKKVAPYKRIRRVAFSDEIPKSSGGKILRRELLSNGSP